MLWRVETVFQKQDAQHKIVEREDEYNKSQHVSDISIGLQAAQTQREKFIKNKRLSSIDKMQIFNLNYSQNLSHSRIDVRREEKKGRDYGEICNKPLYISASKKSSSSSSNSSSGSSYTYYSETSHGSTLKEETKAQAYNTTTTFDENLTYPSAGEATS